MFGHHRPVTWVERVELADELATTEMALSVTDRACCCPARPVVLVVMPPGRSRPEPVDLLLCGHHYRVSQGALQAAGAAVYNRQGVLIMGSADKSWPRPREAAAAA
jgi:hypothetical protein